MKNIFVVILLVSLFSSLTFAQEASVTHKSGPRRQLATIVFAGLGGAILGLSTLSFYGRPQDHLSNIALGFAAGVIGGTIYVTYKSATSRDYYDNPQSSITAPVAKREVEEEAEPSGVQWAPLISRNSEKDTALGGQFALRF